jgi:hypothetical protein
MYGIQLSLTPALTPRLPHEDDVGVRVECLIAPERRPGNPWRTGLQRGQTRVRLNAWIVRHQDEVHGRI